jgi:hypothetical protein
MIVGQIIGNEKLELDLPTLVDTRLLIQANSGWLASRIVLSLSVSASRRLFWIAGWRQWRVSRQSPLCGAARAAVA